jgi:hypothetical protein
MPVEGRRRRVRLRIRTTAILALALGDWAIAGCGSEGTKAPVERPLTEVHGSMPIEEVLKENAPGWMALDGVVGVYQGRTEDGAPCLKVMVVKETPELHRKIPEQVHGYPVLLRETGPIGPRGGR